MEERIKLERGQNFLTKENVCAGDGIHLHHFTLLHFYKE